MEPCGIIIAHVSFKFIKNEYLTSNDITLYNLPGAVHDTKTYVAAFPSVPNVYVPGAKRKQIEDPVTDTKASQRGIRDEHSPRQFSVSSVPDHIEAGEAMYFP